VKLIMQFSPASYYFIPLRSKHSPQQPVLKHPQSMLFPQCQKPTFTPIPNYMQNYSFLYFMFLYSRQEDKKEASELNGSKHYLH
jgi:hypothetical protein